MNEIASVPKKSDKQVPQIVKILSILSILGSALIIIASLVILIYFYSRLIIELSSITGQIVILWNVLIVAVNMLSIIGAYKMMYGKKNGFKIYAISNGFWISLLFVAIVSLSLEGQPNYNILILIVISIIFFILFRTQNKR